MALHHCVGNTISIRAPTRRATKADQQELRSEIFQSALPRGERLNTGMQRSLGDKFQSALPRGERPESPAMTVSGTENFNPRSREGSDILTYPFFLIFNISIRAPARGATSPSCGSRSAARNFNPRSCEGSDDFLIVALQQYFISIRAPARGATVSMNWNKRLSSYFNPRSREGSDDNT